MYLLHSLTIMICKKCIEYFIWKTSSIVTFIWWSQIILLDVFWAKIIAHNTKLGVAGRWTFSSCKVHNCFSNHYHLCKNSQNFLQVLQYIFCLFVFVSSCSIPLLYAPLGSLRCYQALPWYQCFSWTVGSSPSNRALDTWPRFLSSGRYWSWHHLCGSWSSSHSLSSESLYSPSHVSLQGSWYPTHHILVFPWYVSTTAVVPAQGFRHVYSIHLNPPKTTPEIAGLV